MKRVFEEEKNEFYLYIDKIYMTIVQLQYVVAVDNLRHFAEAAEYCHVTQPTLSMQLAQT